MQGDFERVTFDPADAFANVLLQQGRLLMPADFNELGAILQHALRQFILDLKGRSWQVDTEESNGAGGVFHGFDIDKISGTTTLEFNVKRGRIYVDGIRCENPVDLAYAADQPQPFWPTPDALDSLTDLAIIYIHCWERHVTWQQNGKLRDVALGGPDTATRVQVAWQVRAESRTLADELDGIAEALGEQLTASSGEDLAALKKRIGGVEALKKLFKKDMTVGRAEEVLREIDRGAPARMAADAKQDESSPDPCAIASDAEYRGRENQLYRVEVNEPGTARTATLKWSRENGSVAFRVLEAVAAEKDADKDIDIRVTLENVGHDRRTGLAEGDWVELVDDDLELGWISGPLLQIKNIDVQRRLVTLKGSETTRLPGPGKHGILRRWDHHSDNDETGALAVNVKKWIELERGIRIRFESGGYYRKGDYWLIPARVATGDIEWPATESGDPLAREPHGITHHRAVLDLAAKVGGTWDVATK